MAYSDTISAHANILHYWRLGEATGPTLAATVGSVSLNLNEGTLGETGQVDGDAVYLDGANDSIESNASIDLSASTKCVVEFLFKFYSDADKGIIFETGQSYNYDGSIHMFLDDSPNIIQTMVWGDAYNNSFDYSKPTRDDWHHLVAVFDTSEPTNETAFYIDGVESTGGNAQINNNTINLGDWFLYIGARYGGASSETEMSIQHFAIYSDLSETDIVAHYEEAFGLGGVSFVGEGEGPSAEGDASFSEENLFTGIGEAPSASGSGTFEEEVETVEFIGIGEGPSAEGDASFSEENLFAGIGEGPSSEGEASFSEENLFAGIGEGPSSEGDASFSEENLFTGIGDGPSASGNGLFDLVVGNQFVGIGEGPSAEGEASFSEENLFTGIGEGPSASGSGTFSIALEIFEFIGIGEGPSAEGDASFSEENLFTGIGEGPSSEGEASFSEENLFTGIGEGPSAEGDAAFSEENLFAGIGEGPSASGNGLFDLVVGNYFTGIGEGPSAEGEASFSEENLFTGIGEGPSAGGYGRFYEARTSFPVLSIEQQMEEFRKVVSWACGCKIVFGRENDGGIVRKSNRIWGELELLSIAEMDLTESELRQQDDEGERQEVMIQQTPMRWQLTLFSRKQNPAQSAWVAAMTAKSRLNYDFIREKWLDPANISIVDISGIVDRPRSFDNRVEDMAIFEILIYTVIVDADLSARGSWIETVQISSDLQPMSDALQLDEELIP